MNGKYNDTGGSRRIAPPIFTSTQDGSGQLKVPTALTPEKAPPSTNSVGRTVCPRASLDVLQKRKLSCLCWESCLLWGSCLSSPLHKQKWARDFCNSKKKNCKTVSVLPPLTYVLIMRKWIHRHRSSMIFTPSFRFEVKALNINKTYQCFSVPLYEVDSRYKWRE